MPSDYFEGREQGRKLAKYGRSKQKRSDAKIVVLGLVINPEGFIKYPSIGRYFDIETQVSDEPELKQKKKGAQPGKEKKRIVSSIKWAVKEGVDINARSGVYFLRTSLQAQ